MDVDFTRFSRCYKDIALFKGNSFKVGWGRGSQYFIPSHRVDPRALRATFAIFTTSISICAPPKNLNSCYEPKDVSLKLFYEILLLLFTL